MVKLREFLIKEMLYLPQSSDRKQRTTRPVAPENSALADELRSQLKGKPTRTGFNRSWMHETAGFVGDILRVVIVALLCLCFAFGGFGAGMLLGYASTTKPLSIGDLLILMMRSSPSRMSVSVNIPVSISSVSAARSFRRSLTAVPQHTAVPPSHSRQ